jgi:uncharacterized protein with GYD domain
METFVMLTRVSADVARSPRVLEELEQRAMERVRSECPAVRWTHSLALLGPYEYLDIFTAPDVQTATKVATLIRTYGRAHAEVWPAVEWQTFKTMLKDLPHAA